MSTPLLSVTKLRISFGCRVIIPDLTFQVESGDCLSVIGPNGAGKTVLLRALLNLIPYEGEIRWTPGARLGYVPQRVVAGQHLPISVRDLLAAKADILKLPEGALAGIFHEVALAPELLDCALDILSGGQLQKVLIAFALLGRPNVLLFDEPTASLDELSEERIYERIHSLKEEMGITVILVSHDLSVVYRYSNKVLCLSKGAPCMGPPHEVLTPALLEELYAAPSRYYRHIDGHRES